MLRGSCLDIQIDHNRHLTKKMNARIAVLENDDRMPLTRPGNSKLQSILHYRLSLFHCHIALVLYICSFACVKFQNGFEWYESQSQQTKKKHLPCSAYFYIGQNSHRSTHVKHLCDSRCFLNRRRAILYSY